jgi:hypothetical protein
VHESQTILNAARSKIPAATRKNLKSKRTAAIDI